MAEEGDGEEHLLRGEHGDDAAGDALQEAPAGIRPVVGRHELGLREEGLFEGGLESKVKMGVLSVLHGRIYLT